MFYYFIYSGSYRNNYSSEIYTYYLYKNFNENFFLGRGGGGYGFRRQNNNDEDEIEILKEAIFIQNLPKNITRDDIQEAFSTVGPIKVNHFIF